MRLELQYPVDRYLVESSKKFEMVNIIDDDIWNTEPTLRPEDEIILRKLHEMLQSTADDLKLLSGELSKFHEPRVQVKTLPTPLDEDFNEKVHIEEIVNAKFHGYKFVDKPTTTFSELKPQNNVADAVKLCNISRKKIVTGVQVNAAPILKNTNKNKNLNISRTNIVQINENPSETTSNKLNNLKVSKINPAVAYNEYSYKYVEPKTKAIPKKQLQVQEMPSINIRSELKEQKVLNINIIPETQDNKVNNTNKSNVSVIAITYKEPNQVPVVYNSRLQHPEVSVTKIQPMRKIQKMSTCESSESSNNISSDAQHKTKTKMQIKDAIMSSSKVTGSTTRVDRSRNIASTLQKSLKKPPHLNLEQWKKKLNIVYGPSGCRKNKLAKEIKRKTSPKKTNPLSPPEIKSQANTLNNANYIPYSRLTLGGVRVSDIEKEIADIPNKKDLQLTPILDRILTSRENSFLHESPRKPTEKDSSRILTTSDENLLQEVIDIERTVSKTLSKDTKIKKNNSSDLVPDFPVEKNDDGINENHSYDDDFEDEKSEQSIKQLDSQSGDTSCSNFDKESSNNKNDDRINIAKSNVQNTTFTKISNLSFKNSVDIFEYVHALDTQDSATQSFTGQKKSLKETQTSPRNDERNVQPIHNDLWPSIDPTGDVETLFKLEKDFIKKLIIDEYGDILEKNITKPSTSEDKNEVDNKDKNVAASQKNTQTSPAHVKSVMTSPRRTKTRTTSPFALSLTADQQTSPIIFITGEEELKVDLENEENLGVSINLSSPRFSLRLPQTSREVISNLEVYSNRCNIKQKRNERINNGKGDVNTSSSVDADNSSSEISSLGEVKLKLRKRIKKNRALTSSESSSTSIISKYSSDLQNYGVLPLRSEGELSLGQTTKKTNKSDGETSMQS